MSDTITRFEEINEDRPAINRQYIINYFKNAHTIHHEHKAYSKLPPCEFDISTLFKFEDGSYFCTKALNVGASSDILMYDKESDKLADIISYAVYIKQSPWTEENEERQRIVEQNGNDGLHYDTVDRKSMPIFSGVLKYFPDALKEVSKCSLAGQKQHNQGDQLYWDKNKSTDNSDALVRHLIDHENNPIDDDGILHLAKVAWRALATLQIFLDKSVDNK